VRPRERTFGGRDEMSGEGQKLLVSRKKLLVSRNMSALFDH